MKTVVSISLGPAGLDFDFRTRFLGKRLRVLRIGTDGDTNRAEMLLQEWQQQADAIGLGAVRDHRQVGVRKYEQAPTRRLLQRVTRIPATTGARLRDILQDWSIRHTQSTLPGFFNNSRTLFMSGAASYRAAQILAEFTDNLVFADPVRELGIPKFLTSLPALELYAAGTHPLLSWQAPQVLRPSLAVLQEWNQFLLRKALHKAHVVAAGFDELEPFGLEELAGKTVLSATISRERLASLGERGVDMVVDYTPVISGRLLGVNVVEAMIMAALEKRPEELGNDDLLEIIESLGIEPRILYPAGFKRRSRFAFVIHPLSQQYLAKARPLDTVARFSPPPVMDALEKIMAYSPPFTYSRVTGIKSPTGAEAEGWLITVGGTPKEIMAHSPEFTYRRLLAAAEMARRMGAQIMGLGAFTKVIGDAGITVAKRAPLPITTGNSYSASGALWAAHEATLRLGLVQVGPSGRMAGKAMVVGATGAIGSVCARLLARAVDELYLVSPESAKLLALKETIEHETDNSALHLMATAERHLGDMDMIVTATSGAGKKILDIMQVKPGCVITDVARPLDIPAEDVAKRPDVLVIESGEIRLPGEVRMKDIGLPPNVVFACLAETIVLALEGRFENFTLGRQIEWEKVREIYQLGLKHGMQLAAISGVNGPYSDADLQQVRELALAARETTARSKPKARSKRTPKPKARPKPTPRSRSTPGPKSTSTRKSRPKPAANGRRPVRGKA